MIIKEGKWFEILFIFRKTANFPGWPKNKAYIRNVFQLILISKNTTNLLKHDSFVITEGEKDHDPGALSHQLQVTDLVEKILEGKIDLESCADCNHLLMAELNKRIKQVEQDTQHYRTALDAFGKDVQVSNFN